MKVPKFFFKVLLVFVFGIMALLYFVRLWTTHPSDKTLIENFERNQKTFVALVEMIKVDRGLERVDDTWTQPDDLSSIDVTNERIVTYRKLFKDLDIPRGFVSLTDPIRITLIASTLGLSISGSSKGYAYLERTPDLVVDNLDDYFSPDGRSFTAYRHLTGNWYLYYDFED